MCASRIGSPRGTRECRWRAIRKNMTVHHFSCFFRFLSCHHPVHPVQRGERRSPLQPSKGRRARTQGHARDAQGHPRVPQVRRGHSQTLRGHIWEISFFYDFLTNLEIFWSKNGHFSLVNPMKMTPKVHFFTGRT